jgi:hypothetical protein
MKKLLSVSVFLVSLTTPVGADQNEFCAGYERGYITGYKQSSGSSFDPFPPFCPFQPFKGFNDPESDYEHGYIIGYEDGVRAGYN